MNRSNHPSAFRSFSNSSSTPPMVGGPHHQNPTTSHHSSQFPPSLSQPSGVNGSVFSESPVAHPVDLNASTTATDSVGSFTGGSNGGSTTNVFEGEIPVYTKQMNREEVCQPLGVCVSLGRGGASGVSKCINIRVTDPKDPFFLFSVSLLEDDYGKFKERQELNVDFNGFPRDLVNMINSVANCNSNNCIVFVVDGPQSAVLRILEKTEFRSLEHLSMTLTRQGDVGQKKYLAEKFGHFLSAYNKSESLRHDEGLRTSSVIAELRDSLNSAESTIAGLNEKLKLEHSNSSASHMSVIAQLKDNHANEVRAFQQAADEERQQLTRKIDVLQSQLSSEKSQKDEEISKLRAQLHSYESNKSTLETQLRIAEDSLKNNKLELESVRKHNSELQEFRTQATKKMSESELSNVSVSERLRYLTDTLSNREAELRLARDQRAQQDDHSNTLAEQLKSVQEKLKANESSLAKAHHILGSQVQAIKGSKDKYNSLKAHLESNEALLIDKNNQLERMRSETSSMTDKVEHFQSKVTDLKDQLMKAEEQNTSLASQLKQNEDALIHLQRMSSGFGTRVQTASASPQLTSFSGANLYRQFAAGSSSSYAGTGNTFLNPTPSANVSSSAYQSVGEPDSQTKENAVGATVPKATTHINPSSPTFTSVHSNNVLTQQNSLSSGIRNSAATTSSSYGSHLSNGNVGAVSYLNSKQKANVVEKPSAYFS